jgi:hypothetical protein
MGLFLHNLYKPHIRLGQDLPFFNLSISLKRKFRSSVSCVSMTQLVGGLVCRIRMTRGAIDIHYFIM